MGDVGFGLWARCPNGLTRSDLIMKNIKGAVEFRRHPRNNYYNISERNFILCIVFLFFVKEKVPFYSFMFLFSL